MARKITDEDIVEALTGTGSADRDVIGALRGTSKGERRADNAVLEALGVTPPVTLEEGELPLQTRGDEFEAVAIWAAEEAAATATKALAEAIMRADGNKGIYLAEAEARDIAAEAYATAAKESPYEDHRQKHVAHAVTKLAETIGRPRTVTSESKTTGRPATASPPHAKKPLRKKTTVSGITGHTIEYYG